MVTNVPVKIIGSIIAAYALDLLAANPDSVSSDSHNKLMLDHGAFLHLHTRSK